MATSSAPRWHRFHRLTSFATAGNFRFKSDPRVTNHNLQEFGIFKACNKDTKNGAMMYWFNVRIKNAGVVSSNPIRVSMKTRPWQLKNHLFKSTSLDKTPSPVSGFCYARNRVCNTAGFIQLIASLRTRHDRSYIRGCQSWSVKTAA